MTRENDELALHCQHKTTHPNQHEWRASATLSGELHQPLLNYFREILDKNNQFVLHFDEAKMGFSIGYDVEAQWQGDDLTLRFKPQDRFEKIIR